MKIIKYGAPWCSACKALTKSLENAGIPFEDRDIEDTKYEEEVKNFRSIPVIEIRDDDYNLVKSFVGNTSIEDIKMYL